MKVVLKIENLCCANCAAKIENEVKKLNGLSDVMMAFMTQKLSFEVADSDADAVVEQVIKIVKKVEDEAVVKRLK